VNKKPNPKPTIDDLCAICETPYAHTHEVFFGNPNAALSQKHGMTIRLCQKHHQDHKEGVHHNREFDLELKRKYQAIFEETHTREEFESIFKRNYL